MNYGLYVSAMGLKAQQEKLAVISNNIANMGTTGFKADLAMMRSRANAGIEDPRMGQYRIPTLDSQGGGVFALGAGLNMSQGIFKDTGAQTDVALDGDGFFTVQGDRGEKLLTRDGSFLINRDGQLVTQGGRQVLDDSGAAITLNPALPVTVSAQGEVSQGDGAGGAKKLGIVKVADTRQLRKLGANLLVATNPDAVVPTGPETQVLQGHLEESSVNEATELVNMIQGQRVFEANAKMITYQDTAMSQLNTVGRVA